jgi:hypothetical protein
VVNAISNSSRIQTKIDFGFLWKANVSRKFAKFVLRKFCFRETFS